MKTKKKILSLIMSLVMAGGVQAQIFNTQADGNNMRNQTDLFGTESLGTFNIIDGHTSSTGTENLGNTEISPLGSGLFLLAGMAGAYALTRRKKQDDK